jgi:hypothetical protein
MSRPTTAAMSAAARRNIAKANATKAEHRRTVIEPRNASIIADHERTGDSARAIAGRHGVSPTTAALVLRTHLGRDLRTPAVTWDQQSAALTGGGILPEPITCTGRTRLRRKRYAQIHGEQTP